MAYANRLDKQWDFKTGEDDTALAYLYLNDSTVAVGQNYRSNNDQKVIGLDAPYGYTDYSWYSGVKNIPATVTYKGKTYTVVSIFRMAFHSALGVRRVTLPPTIEEIQEEAFCYSFGLNTIKLNNGLKRIGESAFYFCKNLMEVIIPDNVTQLGRYAFGECQSLREVVIGSGISKMEGTFRACDDLSKITCRAITPPGVTQDFFSEVAFQNATLYVPFVAWEAYKKHYRWKNFKKIEPIPGTIPTGQFSFMVSGIRYVTKGDNSNEVHVAPLEKGVYSEETINKAIRDMSGGVFVAPKVPHEETHKLPKTRRETLSTIQSYSLEIPGQVNYANKIYAVTGIGKLAFRDSTLPMVKLPDTIKAICNGAFDHAEITSIVIPDSVQIIEEGAFFSCLNLTEIEIPAKVATIEDNAFEGCENIKKIVLKKGLNKICAYAFDDIFELQELTIPNTVIEIGKNAFSQSGCKSSQRLSITIPDNVVTIGEGAFYHCRLRSLTLGKGLSRIENEVFAGSELKELVIPNGITSIGKKAFANNNNFQSITCKSGTPPKIEEDTFDSQTFENAKLNVLYNAVQNYKNDPVWGRFRMIGPIPEGIPEGQVFYFTVDGIRYVTKGDNNNEVYVAPLRDDPNHVRTLAEDEYYHAKEIDIPSHVEFGKKTYVVTGIDKLAFVNSTTPIVKLPNTLKYIGYRAFENNVMSSIIIPGSVQRIEEEAFIGCDKLTEIEIPDSVATIENATFEDCNSIKRIILHKGLKTIRGGFNELLELQELTIPDTVVEIGEYAFCQSGSISPRRLSITIPDNVVTIGEGAFIGCRLGSLTLGKGLSRIEDEVFAGSELKELVIPNGITSIGKKAFADNNNFQSITCKSGTPPKIEEDTFDSQTFENAKLNVLYNAVNDYKNDPVWGRFGQIEGFYISNKPENPTQISEPIRYISLKNEGAFKARINIDSICGTYHFNNDIFAGKEETVDLANDGFLKKGFDGWLTVVVVDGKNNTANQIFDYKDTSNKMACYTIKGNTLNNKLVFRGIEECAAKAPESPKEEHWNFEVNGIRYWVKDANSKVVYVTNKDKGKYEGKLVIPPTVVSEDVTYKVTKVGNYAFKNCPQLTEVTLPESITEVKEEAFYGCTNLAFISCRALNPPKVMENAFPKALTKRATLGVPQNQLSEYMKTDGWKSFINVKGQ
jgi:hypothetical protein